MNGAVELVATRLDVLRQCHLEVLAVGQETAVVIRLRAVEVRLLLLILRARVARRRVAAREEARLGGSLDGIARSFRQERRNLLQLGGLLLRVRVGLLDLVDQVGSLERLGDVVPGAGVDARDHVEWPALRGQHDEWDIADRRIILERLGRVRGHSGTIDRAGAQRRDARLLVGQHLQGQIVQVR